MTSVERRKTRRLQIGDVPIGGGAPISVQSMISTPTQDVEATTAQISSLAALGCDIVRVAVPDQAGAEALGTIIEQSALPVVADIHFDYRLALAAIAAGCQGLRLNPGNIRRTDRVREIVESAKEKGIPIRIGVNGGSLAPHWRVKIEKNECSLPEAMVESALEHVRILEGLNFHDIKISLKASDVAPTVEAYRLMAQRRDYPFHVGVTEAGTVWSGTIKSAAGIGALLMDGLCDTIRVSLTGPVEEEVRVAKKLLSVFGLRSNGPELISCPTCGRRSIDIERLAAQIEKRLESVREPLRVAVMGCVVNGPGEAREADIGIAGGGGRGIVFRRGEIVRRCPADKILETFEEELRKLLSDQSAES
ncbi:MAG: flavodoxin-dependent (E)-4-hydroxy-3-methylbut-2-enyl-diphosphate synthase [Candidatus Sumerlaeota bacterium]